MRRPVFPLSQAPLPGVCLPLRIFERRYLDMVRRQLRAGDGFVVATIREGKEVGPGASIWPLGVEVSIVDWDQLPDGLLGITIQGRAISHMDEMRLEPDGLMTAACQTQAAATAGDQPLADNSWDGLRLVLAQLKQHPSVQSLALAEVDTEAELGWQLLQLLPLPEPERQRAMALTPSARLQWLAEALDRLSHQ